MPIRQFAFAHGRLICCIFSNLVTFGVRSASNISGSDVWLVSFNSWHSRRCAASPAHKLNPARLRVLPSQRSRCRPLSSRRNTILCSTCLRCHMGRFPCLAGRLPGLIECKTAQPVKFNVGPNTLVRQGSETRSVADLKPGALISLTFGPEQGRAGTVREISVLAQPGTQFLFFGPITYMDLSRKLIAVANESDNTTYEIYLETLPPGSLRGARPGGEVRVSAVFDGKHYVARSIEPANASSSIQ